MVTNTTGSGAAATPIVAGKRVHICGLHIENYRSIINYDFSFSPDCNILVGQNNVGKSNLLKALDIVIGERSQTLYPKDYNDPDSDIIIRVTLCWHSVPTTIHQEGQCCQGSEQVVLEFKCAAIRRDDVLIKDKQKGEVTLAQNSSGETLPTIKRKLRFIYIPSLRDYAKAAGTAESSPFQDLLSVLLDNPSDTAKIEHAMQRVNTYLRGWVARTSVADLGNRIKLLLPDSMNVNDIDLEVREFTQQTLLKQIKIMVDDGRRTDVEDKGYGLQNSIVLAMLQLQAQQNNDTIILGIEEPEIGLHAQAQRHLFRTLSNVGDTIQIILSTHSPSVATMWHKRDMTDGIMILNRNPNTGGTEGNRIKSAQFSAAEREVVRRHLLNAGGEIFFANKVILVEGRTELGIVPGLARHMNHDLDGNNITVVRVEGYGEIPPFIRLCHTLGIKYFALFDLDALKGKDKSVCGNISHALGAPSHFDAGVATSVISNINNTGGPLHDRVNDANYRLEQVHCHVLGSDVEGVFVRALLNSPAGRRDDLISLLYDIYSKTESPAIANAKRANLYTHTADALMFERTLLKFLRDDCKTEFYWRIALESDNWPADYTEWIDSELQHVIQLAVQ